LIAVARILLPQTRLRIAAGRTTMSIEAQAYVYLREPIPFFMVMSLLTTPNPNPSDDNTLIALLGLKTVTTRECTNPEGETS